jgi:hypothetical protein
MCKSLAWLILLAGCGGSPVLSGLPRPNKTAAAGIALGAAAAATAIDPQGGQRIKEAGEEKEAQKRPIEVKETIPPDLLDKIDQANTDADGDADANANAGGAPKR